MSKRFTFSDEELIKRIAEGDQKAFNKVFERYRDRLFYYLQKVTKSKEVSEEIVLDVFLKIWTGRSILIEIDHFEAFLFTIARNKALDFLRKAQKDQRRQSELWDRLREKKVAETADQELLLAEVDLSVKQAIAGLSPQRKLVFQLSRDQELTYTQIGKKLNLSPHTVRNHLSASLKFIRAHLEARHGSTFMAFVSWVFFY